MKFLLLSVLYYIHKISIMVNANIILFDPTYSMLHRFEATTNK